MKIDSTTEADDLVNTVLLSGDKDARNAARAELARRSRDAERYARLTRALAWAINRGDIATRSEIEREHDGTPDSIADAIIATEEAGR